MKNLDLANRRLSYKQKQETALHQLRKLAFVRGGWAGFTKDFLGALERLCRIEFNAVGWMLSEGAFEQILDYAIFWVVMFTKIECIFLTDMRTNDDEGRVQPMQLTKKKRSTKIEPYFWAL